ncbi:hemolysin family protein [Actinomyces sp. B33]|uniref:hemolysin family protein n=1 Tax=Actinomyces sp. B33 TaxID=2942131 RepID=UPI00234125FB|nr:hemolysin family protein [Actinomyces sp. B33]MDC4232724.1 hemolysin family protein [Actinomyces sp. B33]
MTSAAADSIPVAALLVVTVVALAAASLLQALDVAFQRLSLAAVDDLVDEDRPRAHDLRALLGHRTRASLALRGGRTFFQVVVAVLVTLLLVRAHLPWWVVALVSVGLVSTLQFFLVSLLPTRWGGRRPEGIALAGTGAASAMVAATRAFDPLVERIRGRLPQPAQTEAEARAEMANDLREMVDQVGETEGLEDEDREMLRSVLDLGHTLVREVMVPRTAMVTADAGLPAGKALRLFVRSGFSRVPVVGDDVDDIRGILYFKDVVARRETHGRDLDLTAEQMMRPVEYTIEMKPADDLLRQMQADHFHMAIVIDEYGGVAGLVTLEDLIEEVVGELTDEHDRHVVEPEEIAPGVWRVPSRLPIGELGELVGLEIEDEDVDSVGGLLAKAIGRVPLPGAVGEAAGVRMEAEEARGRRRQVGTIVCSRIDEDGVAGPDETDKEN